MNCRKAQEHPLVGLDVDVEGGDGDRTERVVPALIWAAVDFTTNSFAFILMNASMTGAEIASRMGTSWCEALCVYVEVTYMMALYGFLACHGCITKSHHMCQDGWPWGISHASCSKGLGFSDLVPRLVESDRKSINDNWVAGLYKASSSCRTVFFLDCQPSQRLLSYFCNLIGCRSLTFCTRHLCLATYPLTSDAAFKRVASKPWKA